MAGLLQASAKKKGGKNPMLQKAADQVESKVPPELKRNYDAIVLSGMKIMFDKKTHAQMTDMLQKGPDIVQSVSQGIAMLITIISQEAKGRADRTAAMAASIVLMIEALDYAEKAMGVQITPDLLADCTSATKQEMFKIMKITPEMEQQAVEAGRQAKQGGAPTGVLGRGEHQSYPVSGNAANLVGGA